MTEQIDKRSLIAAASIVVAIVVMAVKYLAYHVTGSVALYSDALESIVNVVTAVVALVALQVSRKPADGATSSAITRRSTSRPCSKAC